MMRQNDVTELVLAESEKLYKAIFGGDIPQGLRKRFCVASDLLNAAVLPTELDRYYRAMLACADLEALELAARYTHRLPLLSRKFRLMVYLAETLPENQPFFINERPGFLAGMARSAAGTFRTVFKMMKGLWIMRRVAHA